MHTPTATIMEAGGGLTVWTNVTVNGITQRIETSFEILEVFDDGGVMVVIDPPPANINIVTAPSREGPLTGPSALH